MISSPHFVLSFNDITIQVLSLTPTEMPVYLPFLSRGRQLEEKFLRGFVR